MSPAEDSTHECPHCGKLVRRANWGSWNTFGSKRWSDGHIIGPFYPPDEVRVIRCPYCRWMYWLEDARQHGDLPTTTPVVQVVRVKRKWWFGYREEKRVEHEDSVWAHLPYVTQLDITGLMEALERLGPTSDPGREEYLRVRIWWALNTPLREDPYASLLPSTEKAIRENLEKLLPLLSPEQVRTKLMHVSVLVALGRFDHAQAVLSTSSSERAPQLREALAQAIEERNSRLFRMW